MPYNAELGQISKFCFSLWITQGHSKVFPTKLLMSSVYSLVLLVPWRPYAYLLFCAKIDYTSEVQQVEACSLSVREHFIWYLYSRATDINNDILSSLYTLRKCTCQKVHGLIKCFCRCLGPSKKLFLSFSDPSSFFFPLLFFCSEVCECYSVIACTELQLVRLLRSVQGFLNDGEISLWRTDPLTQRRFRSVATLKHIGHLGLLYISPSKQ